MNPRGLLPGLLLIGGGLLILLTDWGTLDAHLLLTWPTFYLLIGIALFIQGTTAGKVPESIFAGTLFTAIGIHFHAVEFGLWPHHTAIFLLVIGAAFFMVYAVTRRDGRNAGIFFFLAAAGVFFSNQILEWLGTYREPVESFWPLLFIAGGFAFIFFSRRK
ncbi:hypothetical protein B0H94_10958 [Salsuginibacillus halophilus]|uniref:LiaF transmembrane domain-containing protein n=1 Tax=Salsuginibacillus halophilus TaxID=517424 RepID=A0A2P8HD01_9BACI|nr:hypothetical protein [Salsuginibacillus halophilus]PSL44001.1 hypothetical protein B0H94_10958 [Salsuginibacillus halophilus]